MTGLAHRGFSLNDYSHHMIHTLRRKGYFSALIGVQHIARDPSVIGYDFIADIKQRNVRHVVPAVKQFLSDVPAKPFFLSVGFSETHRKFPKCSNQQDPRYVLPAPTVPDTSETRRDMAMFRTSAQIYDSGVGEVLRCLEEQGLSDETLIINTTDHGIAFPGMKCTLSDYGIGIMLIMRGPGGFTGGKVVDSLVSHIDLFPTLCDYLDIEPPEWLQGVSLMPLVRGEQESVRDEVFAEVSYHAAYEPKRCVRTDRWKYIKRFDGRTRAVLPNCDDSMSKDVWLRHGWAERPVQEEILYDLVFDPHETCNCANDPSCGDVLENMRFLLNDWMERTGDPLIEGKVAAPEGARVNDPDGLSPKDPVKEA
jgi:arylsulfatase A-like enzyme